MALVLRQWRMEDAPALARIIANPKIRANLREIPFPYTVADAEAYIRSALDAEPDTLYQYAIQVEGEVAGSLGLFRQSNIHRQTAELGYYLTEEHWGKGIVSAAVEEACCKAFAETDLLRIFAQPFAQNIASCRVLEKAGFVREGILRQNAVKDGRVLDMVMYARLRVSDPSALSQHTV